MSQRAFGRRRGSPVRTAGGCLLVIVAIALFSGAMDLFWTRVDERRFPWAYPAPGRSTLTGAWVGALTTGRGATRGVYLDVRLDSLNLGSTGRRRRGSPSGRFRRAQSRKLEGDARVCGGPGPVKRFEMSGNNEDGAASRFWMGFSAADSVPPDGLAPSHLRGRWDGRDSIAMEVDLYLRNGASAISGGDDPDTGRPAEGGLRRASEAEFQALCARLAMAR